MLKWGLIALAAYLAFTFLSGMHAGVVVALRHQFSWMIP